jgi:putative pyruvate formate lyase activating enzyme
MRKKRITEKLTDDLYDLLAPCRICPRECGVDRKNGEVGSCKAGLKLKISSYHQHFGEEAPLVGRYGSGTIFFSHCNMHCVYCQNYEISQLGIGGLVSEETLAGIMIQLQDRGCPNINLVTPTPWVPQIVKALGIACEKGLIIPVVYNCGGYESLNTLKMLDGIIDIYMPDLKYADDDHALKYSDAPGYWGAATAALIEMHCQVGDLVVENGIARKGLLIRHLVLPNNIAGSEKCFNFIMQKLSAGACVNVMAQYHPEHDAHKYPEIDRYLKPSEFQQAIACLRSAGLKENDL